MTKVFDVDVVKKNVILGEAAKRVSKDAGRLSRQSSDYFGGPFAALLHKGTGSWTSVFAVCIAADVTAAALALFVLKPMRRRALLSS